MKLFELFENYYDINLSDIENLRRHIYLKNGFILF